MTEERFEEFLRETPDLAMASLTRLAGLVRYLCGKVYESHALPVSQRTRKKPCSRRPQRS